MNGLSDIEHSRIQDEIWSIKQSDVLQGVIY